MVEIAVNSTERRSLEESERTIAARVMMVMAHNEMGRMKHVE